MEVLGTCHIDGVPLEICRFSIDNVSEELSCDDLFQRHMIEQWHAVFEARERDAPNLLSASRDCRVHTSTVGALWRECAFVLQPKEPLPNGPASHQQRLLALTVGAKEKLTPEELADRVRATYGATAVLHKQKLQRHGGVGGGRRGGNSASECPVCVYSYIFFVSLFCFLAWRSIEHLMIRTLLTTLHYISLLCYLPCAWHPAMNTSA